MIASSYAPYILRESHTLNILQSRIHGLDHWWRVWKNAQLLIRDEPSADLEVIGMYAMFHDSMRVNDGDDPDHGVRGYKLWERNHQIHGHDVLLRRQKEIFFEACAEHNKGYTSSNPTIAVCWDADRLDLHRMGIWPDARLMSTQDGINLTMNRITP